MILSALVATPLIGAVVLAVMPRASGEDSGKVPAAKVVALAFSLVAFALAIVALSQFVTGDGSDQLTEQYTWIAPLGANIAFGVNGISLTLLLLTTVLVPIVILASFDDRVASHRSYNSYFGWMLALQGLALGVFAADDVFLFYLLFEATLVPIYFLIGGFGGANRSYAAVKFLIYNLVGGLLMLASIVGLYVLSAQSDGGPSFLIADLAALDLDGSHGRWLFLGFFAAFAIKAPLWPFHTWLPDAAGSASAGTSVLMVSIVDKIGTYGMISLCLVIFPEASRWAAPTIMVLAVISVIYGALLAIGQEDIRRLIAYTSVSHFGFIVLGIFAFTQTSSAGSTLYMFNHGLSTAALFLVAGILIKRRGSGLIGDFGGVQSSAPVLSGVFLIAGLSSLSLPGLAPFVSEFLVLIGTFTVSKPAAIIATLAIILAALYILIMYQRIMTGPPVAATENFKDLTSREVVAFTPAILLIVALGFFPQPVLDMINPSVDRVLDHVGATEPSPHTPVDLSTDAEGGH